MAEQNPFADLIPKKEGGKNAFEDLIPKRGESGTKGPQVRLVDLSQQVIRQDVEAGKARRAAEEAKKRKEEDAKFKRKREENRAKNAIRSAVLKKPAAPEAKEADAKLQQQVARKPATNPNRSKEFRDEVNAAKDSVAKTVRKVAGVVPTGHLPLPGAREAVADFLSRVPGEILLGPIDKAAEVGTIANPAESLETQLRAAANIGLAAVPLEEIAAATAWRAGKGQVLRTAEELGALGNAATPAQKFVRERLGSAMLRPQGEIKNAGRVATNAVSKGKGPASDTITQRTGTTPGLAVPKPKPREVPATASPERYQTAFDAELARLQNRSPDKLAGIRINGKNPTVSSIPDAEVERIIERRTAQLAAPEGLRPAARATLQHDLDLLTAERTRRNAPAESVEVPTPAQVLPEPRVQTEPPTILRPTQDVQGGVTQILGPNAPRASAISQLPGSAPGERFAGSNLASNDVRAASGLNPVQVTPKVSAPDDFTLARAEFNLDNVISDSRLALSEVGKGGRARVLSRPEQLRIGMAEAELKGKYNALTNQINQGITAGQDVRALQSTRNEVSQDLADVTQANTYFGSEAGRSLSSRNLAMQADYTPAGLYAEARATLGRDLSKGQQELLEKIGIRHTEYTQRIKDLEEQLAKREAERSIVAQSRSRRAMTPEQKSTAAAQRRATERAEAAARIAEVAKRAVLSNSATSGVDVTKFAGALKEIAPDVKIIIRTLAEDGVEKLDDLVKGVRAELNRLGTDLDDAEIIQIAGNRYEGAEKRTVGEVARRRFNLVSQARKALDADKRAAEEAYKASLAEGREVIRKATVEGRARTQAEAARIRTEAQAQAKAIREKAEADLKEATRRFREEEAYLKQVESQKIADARKEGRKFASAEREEYRQYWRDRLNEENAALQKGTREALAGDRAAAREKALLDEIADLENQMAARDAQMPKSGKKAPVEKDPLVVRRDELKAQMRQMASEARKEYAQTWRESIPAKRERLYEQIEDLQAKIDAGDFQPPKKKPPLEKELEDLIIKRKSLEVDADNAKARLRAEAEIRNMPRWERGLREASGSLRGLKATLDLSAVLNQGLFFIPSRPASAAKSTWDMFKSFLSTAEYNRLRAGIRADKALFDKATAAGLKLNTSDLDEPAEFISSRILGGNWSILGKNVNPMAASDRAYTAFLNRMRIDTFEKLVQGQERPWMGRFGVPKELSLDELKQTAEYVNTVTGVGTGKLANSLKGLNDMPFPLMFAPGYRVSRWKTAMASPAFNAAIRGNRYLAAQVLRDYALFAGAMYGTVKGLEAIGGKFDGDMSSPTFGKTKMSSTTASIDGGVLKPWQLVANVWKGKNPRTALGTYASTGLAPGISSAGSLIAGKDFGKEYNVKTPEGLRNIALMFAPIQVGTQMELAGDKGLTPEQRAVLVISSILGANSSTR